MHAIPNCCRRQSALPLNTSFPLCQAPLRTCRFFLLPWWDRRNPRRCSAAAIPNQGRDCPAMIAPTPPTTDCGRCLSRSTRQAPPTTLPEGIVQLPSVRRKPIARVRETSAVRRDSDRQAAALTGKEEPAPRHRGELAHWPLRHRANSGKISVCCTKSSVPPSPKKWHAGGPPPLHSSITAAHRAGVGPLSACRQGRQLFLAVCSRRSNRPSFLHA